LTANHPDLARDVASTAAARLGALPGVVAVALGGSRVGRLAGSGSDVDLYVYADTPPDPAARAAVAAALGAVGTEIDNRFWEPGDEWADAASGLGLDIMYRTPTWIEGELDRLLVRHEASVGYSTALWHSIRASEPLVDLTRWYADLQRRAAAPYPEALRRAVVAKNHPILRQSRSSYRRQIEAARDREDWVAVNHRVAALLASFFDVLFALNRATHPGEKRLLAQAAVVCPQRPADLAERVRSLLAAASPNAPRGVDLLKAIDRLVDDLDPLLRDEGLVAPE